MASPEADSAALLAHAWGLEARQLARRRLFGEEVPAPVAAAFAELLERRISRVPLQHLTGLAAFRHLELRVGPGVFVPRPETELLVTEVLDELARLDRDREPFVIDLCSGSGAISLAIASEHPGARVIGIERETEALRWSRLNLDRLESGRSGVDFLSGDTTTVAADHPDWQGLADVVVSNPPYVPDAAVPRDPEVRDHDPAAALYGGGTGLEVPALIIAQAAVLVAPGGLVLMEHAEDQGPQVRALFDAESRLHPAETFPDYTGRDRYTLARARPAEAP